MQIYSLRIVSGRENACLRTVISVESALRTTAELYWHRRTHARFLSTPNERAQSGVEARVDVDRRIITLQQPRLWPAGRGDGHHEHASNIQNIHVSVTCARNRHALQLAIAKEKTHMPRARRQSRARPRRPIIIIPVVHQSTADQQTTHVQGRMWLTVTPVCSSTACAPSTAVALAAAAGAS